MYILIFLATLGSLFGWIALAQVMAFPSFLYALGIIVLLVLELIAALTVTPNKNKKGEDSNENTDNML